MESILVATNQSILRTTYLVWLLNESLFSLPLLWHHCLIVFSLLLMKVHGLTTLSTQESCILAANHARDAMAPFLRSCDRTSTDLLYLKCEMENNDISTPGTIIPMAGKLFYHPTNHNGSRQTGTIKMFKQVTCQYSALIQTAQQLILLLDLPPQYCLTG